MNDLDQLVRGSIDMHLHHGPDTIPMRVDGLEAARLAKDAGMRGIVLKNHAYPTAPLATIVSQLVPDIGIFGSICLDFEVGSLNHHAVAASAKLGAKVVWMPTSSSANTKTRMEETPGQAAVSWCSLLDENGALVPEIQPILSIIKEYDMVLASGHISATEAIALFKEAKAAGIRKMVATHPNIPDFFKETLTVEQQQQLAEMGVLIEFTATEIMPCDLRHDPEEMAHIIKAIGAERCLLSSDMGLSWTLLPAEGMRTFFSSLLNCGITPEEIELMAKSNPAALLGLD